MKKVPQSIRLTMLMFLLPLVMAPSYALAAENGFIQASGTKLMLEGKVFTPKGANLMDHDSLWYSSKTLPGNKWINAKEFAGLKKAGFNSIRIVVKTDYFQDVRPPHAFSEKGFAWLDGVIKQAEKNNLRIILDMHMPTGGFQQDYQINPDNQVFWNDDWYKGRFVDVWREIARRYKDEPAIWAYDIMNEPATTDFAAYQKLVSSAVKAIRTNDQRHIVMLQKGMYIKADQSWGMKYPEIDDMNSAYAIHFYQPTDFTLQSAPWFKVAATSSILYPNIDRAWDKEYLKKQLSLPSETSTTRPVVLTEFGTLFPTKLTGQYEWVVDMARAADELGIGWHYWHLSGDTCKNAFALKTRYSICRPKTYGMLSSLAK